MPFGSIRLRASRGLQALLPASLPLLLAGVILLPGAGAGGGGDDNPAVHAFVGVTVIPVDEERVLENRTVVVRNGVIEVMGPAEEVRVPGEAHRIEGRGRYLIPGLAEMHAHLPGPDADPQWVDDILFLYLANGVTTIRGMLGAPNQLELRDEVAAGERLGPRMILGGPSLSGSRTPTPEAAEDLVRENREAGYDFLKVHPGLSRESWDRMVEVARQEGLTYAGHIPSDVGLRHALETGVSTVDHLDGYLEEVVSDEARDRMADGEDLSLEEILGAVEGHRVEAIAEATQDAGAWNVPTLYLWENFWHPVDPDSMIALPEMQYVPRDLRERWAEMKASRGAASPGVAELHAEVRRDILGALHEAGAGILMGTDSPQMFNVPGFAMHREVPIMEAAGMSPFDVLASGSRNVAQYVREDLGMEGNFGVVAEGRTADLVLLEADPLQDLGALREVAGVMVRGRWLDGREIRAGLAALAARYDRDAGGDGDR